jgi:serine/threonine protein kinase
MTTWIVTLKRKSLTCNKLRGENRLSMLPFGILPRRTLQMAIHVSVEGYDSLEQIGVGGMAAVYKARKVSIDKVVAIKVLFPYLANDESFIERFQREAKAAARIQHENIVNVIDFGDSDGAYYIVMEYYDGRTLEDIFKTHQELPLDIAVQVLLEVCYGLDSAHAQDTVHRDIKPGNVIFTTQGGIKIADFGLAKKSDSTTMITQEGKVLGTPTYMSPEQAAGKNVGPQSDIFSLGVVAYEMFGQKRPFEGKTYSEVIERIQTYEPMSVADINPLIQPDFENVVTKMLEKDLNKRYQTVKEIIVDIESSMEKFRITRDRRRLVSYITDPAAYEAAFKKKVINRCLSQGAFYMKKGQSHLEEATLEFKRILYLDPNNERAKRNLERVRAESGKRVTVTVDAANHPNRKRADNGGNKEDKDAKSVTVVAASGRTGNGRKPRKPRHGRSGLIFGGLFTAAVVLVGGWLGYQRGMIPPDFLRGADNKPPALSAPRHMTVTSGERLEFALRAVDADGDTVRFYVEELPHGATLSETGEFKWKVGYDQAGKHQIKFYADDGKSSSLSETVIEVQAAAVTLDFNRVGTVNVDAGKPFQRPLRARSSSGKRVEYSLKKAPQGLRIDDGKLVWQPARDASGTYKAVVEATDGIVSESQTITFKVRSLVEQEAELAEVRWDLPERANVFVNGDLKQRETRRFEADLPQGDHTLRAELMDGATGWMETINLEPGEKVKLTAPKLEYGNLSVYFLGGVGEFRINGKLFKAQPPFSGETLPVGDHAVSCRMANEAEVKQFTISIVKNRETIIEYETGNEPVITREP